MKLVCVAILLIALHQSDAFFTGSGKFEGKGNSLKGSFSLKKDNGGISEILKYVACCAIQAKSNLICDLNLQ